MVEVDLRDRSRRDYHCSPPRSSHRYRPCTKMLEELLCLEKRRYSVLYSILSARNNHSNYSSPASSSVATSRVLPHSRLERAGSGVATNCHPLHARESPLCGESAGQKQKSRLRLPQPSCVFFLHPHETLQRTTCGRPENTEETPSLPLIETCEFSTNPPARRGTKPTCSIHSAEPQRLRTACPTKIKAYQLDKSCALAAFCLSSQRVPALDSTTSPLHLSYFCLVQDGGRSQPIDRESLALRSTLKPCLRIRLAGRA